MSSSSHARPAIPGTCYGSAHTSERFFPSSDTNPQPTPRADGWTPSRIRTFLDTLAECGVVSDAARAAGMSKQSAYAFRNSARGRGFDVAWRSAQLLARRRLADEVMSRALNGCVEVIIRNGEVWGERRRFDNRLTMAVLTRLDALAESPGQLEDGPRRVAHEFQAFVGSVCEGGDEAAEYLRSRTALPYCAFGEAEIVERNAAYLCDREQGGEVERELSPEVPSAELCVAPGADTGTHAPDLVAPDCRDVGAILNGESDGTDGADAESPCGVLDQDQTVDRAAEDHLAAGQGGDEWQLESSSISLDSAETPRGVLNRDQTIDRAAEDHPAAGQSDDEWQPESSSTSLHLEALSGAVEPGSNLHPPGARMAAPHSLRANRAQSHNRVKSCFVHGRKAASAGSFPHRLVPPSGTPG